MKMLLIFFMGLMKVNFLEAMKLMACQVTKESQDLNILAKWVSITQLLKIGFLRALPEPHYYQVALLIVLWLMGIQLLKPLYW